MQDLDVLSDRLTKERATLSALRADYIALADGRFHWLSTLCLFLRTLVGGARSGDVYAVWSRDLGVDARAGLRAELDDAGAAAIERCGRALKTERLRLSRLRADYASVTRSRFHALRMLWFSCKAVFGGVSPRDSFAAWSPAIPVGTGISAPQSLVGAPSEEGRDDWYTSDSGSHAFRDAALAPTSGQDFIWLGIIDYNYRIQRPQHLAAELASSGNRVFYVSIQFETTDGSGRFRVEDEPRPGVFVVRLRLAGTPPSNIYGGFSEEQVRDIQEALDELVEVLSISSPTVVVEYPSWYRVAVGIAGATVVHDCLDYVGGFSNVPPSIVDLERELITNADLVVTTSEPLAQHVAELRQSVVIRNAADVAFFARAAKARLARTAATRPVVGYFGAIAEWYEVEWVRRCAEQRPEWDFELIGATVGADVAELEALPNVRLLGEQPYASLPEHLARFDVAIIPFRVSELTKCTNPVKLYEYMAAGKPVVASALPEVVAATSLVYVAHDANEFEAQVAMALAEDSPALRKARQRWASEHTWGSRASDLLGALEATSPTVSVVILAYNNWRFTVACLHSVLTFSDYPRLEVVVVDNASTDETALELKRMRQRDSRIKVVRNRANVGFSAGNNAGIRASSGEYVVLLNNDTYVTLGWVRDLIRPLQQDREIGLVGPLSNNIGNEQKVKINYQDMQGMATAARRFVRGRPRQRYATDNLAFFCVAIRREVIERVGLLDEDYGRGFFEDDDYCQRVRLVGYRIVIADDVFVHHHLSASFNVLGVEEKEAQMARNRAIYELRWGPWKPHAYRAAPGFGG